MQQTAERIYHKWTVSEKAVLRVCPSSEVPTVADQMNLSYLCVMAMWKHLHEEKTTEMAHFDYSKIVPLKALFVRCPVCGGTTGVNENAYCHSCLSQWHPLYLYPLEGLHSPDPVD